MAYRPLVMVLIPTVFLVGCLFRDPLTDAFPAPPDPESLPILPSSPSLDVLILGDWGTGDEGQRALADAMASTHAANPPDFVLTVGDNFYPDGVRGPEDRIWETHFETVYEGPFWDSMLFQGILGNHDHHGNPEGQVEYSKVSTKWDMPSRYYALEKSMPGGGSVLFLALDTEEIAEGRPESRIQQEWADSVLRRSSADWIVVGGHHPIATGGWHTPEGAVRRALHPLFGARADIYVSGHNHSTELLGTQVGTLQAVCGGGAGLDNAYRVRSTPSTLASFTNGGWCVLRFWPDMMAVDLHDREGGLQFRHLVGR